MRHLLLLSLCAVALIGCGGSGSSPSPRQRLAGTYEGTWTNVNDPSDTGTSTWTIGEDGRITGDDLDIPNDYSYAVFGTVDAAGNVDASTSLQGGDEVISLTGRLQFDAQGHLTGNLLWASQPPSTYTYTFTRDANQ